MDLTSMIKDLTTQRDQINEVLESLQRLANGQGRRRGRPPKWMEQQQQANSSDLNRHFRKLAAAKKTAAKKVKATKAAA